MSARFAKLRTRIHEAGALAELDELSHTEVFVKSMADAGVQQIVSVQKLVMHPVVTAPPSFQPTFVCKTGSELVRLATSFSIPLIESDLAIRRR